MLNKTADKAAVFAGWREMNDYMRENKIDPMPPQAAASAKARDSDADGDGDSNASAATPAAIDKAGQRPAPRPGAKTESKPDAKPAPEPEEKRAAVAERRLDGQQDVGYT